jgi:CheY-like chemotaxis protein
MSTPAVQRSTQRQYRILLVDDEPAILKMFKSALTNYGFVTEEARDGREAMERLAKGSFDAIVSDINMPGHGGLEFLRAVRERDLDVPVILMTGKPSIETSNKAIEYGAFRCLTKPVMPAALRDVIERAVRIHGVAVLKREALELDGKSGPGDRAATESRFVMAMEGLWVAFQPIVSWSSRKVYGYEALLRRQGLPRPDDVVARRVSGDGVVHLLDDVASRAKLAQTLLPTLGERPLAGGEPLRELQVIEVL